MIVSLVLFNQRRSMHEVISMQLRSRYDREVTCRRNDARLSLFSTSRIFMASLRTTSAAVSRLNTCYKRSIVTASRPALRQAIETHAEGESISRIERLMALSEKMANGPGKEKRVPVPHRLRGTGVWQRSPMVSAEMSREQG